MSRVRVAMIVLFALACQRPSAVSAKEEIVTEHRNLTFQDMENQIELCASDQKTITYLAMKVVDNEIRYDVNVVPNSKQQSWLIRLNLSKGVFRKSDRRYKETGYTLAVTDSIQLGRKQYFSGVWVRAEQPPRPLVLPQGPVPVSGQSDVEFSAVDELMNQFLSEHNVAGAAVAIGFEGQLLYSRGFGWSDVDQRIVMRPNAALRIASISKPMTAVAIMMLVEQGHLKLDDKVVPLLRAARFQRPTDERWEQVTVRQLLEHTGGWDRDVTPDPMFESGTARESLKLKRMPTPRDMVSWQLQQTLDFSPGDRHAYSNFGYCVLGRIIEEVSGQTYDEYVTEHVLQPAVMPATRLGKTPFADRGTDEAHYYMQNSTRATAVWSVLSDRRGNIQPEEVDRPYGAWDLEVMDAHGGWVSTAPDLLRFVSAVFDANTKLLNAASRNEMLKRPDHAAQSDVYWYGCGWQVRRSGQDRASVWHYGALDGSSSLLVRRWDGYSWAVLFNTDKSENGERLSGLIDPLLHPVIP